jgi:hypothetical protein
MNELTIDEALALVHPWLGTWQPMEYNRFGPHNISMPPATDALAMQVLRRLKANGLHLVLTSQDHSQEGEWCLELFGDERTAEGFAILAIPEIFTDDPCDAIILAAGRWLEEEQS